MIYVFIINGLGGSGKSTFCAMAKQHFESLSDNNLCYELSSIDVVKKIATECGWNDDKSAAGREFLFQLKAAMETYNHFPTTSVFSRIEQLQTKQFNANYLFFVNIREKENINYFIKHCPYATKVIKIERVNYISNETNSLIEDINSVNYDSIIYNDDNLSNLNTEAKKFIKQLWKSEIYQK